MEEPSFSERVLQNLRKIRIEEASSSDLAESEAFEELSHQLANDAVGERLKNAEADKAELDNVQIASNIKQRRNYGIAIFVLLCVWLTAVIATVIGSGLEHCPLKLSDEVLIALISGVSVSVIGLFAVVTGYLFPK